MSTLGTDELSAVGILDEYQDLVRDQYQIIELQRRALSKIVSHHVPKFCQKCGNELVSLVTLPTSGDESGGKVGETGGPSQAGSVDSEQEQLHGQQAILIIGDSMLKGLPLKSVPSEKVLIKVLPISGARMDDIGQPLMRCLDQRVWDLIIVHAGTNDLREHDCALEVERLFQMVTTGRPTRFVVSLPIARFDDEDCPLDDVSRPDRAYTMRVYVAHWCRQKGIPFMSHAKIVREHVGRGGLHLNSYGKTVFATTLSDYFSGQPWEFLLEEQGSCGRPNCECSCERVSAQPPGVRDQ
jgi:hypothetical protein